MWKPEFAEYAPDSDLNRVLFAQTYLDLETWTPQVLPEVEPEWVQAGHTETEM